jgi:photosystem II stability/assembly factor-like uncharacterized protein
MKKTTVVLLIVLMFFSLFQGSLRESIVQADSTQVQWVNITQWIDGYGSITCFSIDPSNSNVLYFGTAGGSLYKSNDAGDSWNVIYKFLGSISQIAIDPRNSHIMYLVVEYNYLYELYKYVDGTLSRIDTSNEFLTASGGFPGREFRLITTPTKVYVLAYVGITGSYYISTDGCKSWKQTDSKMWNIVLIDPKNQNIIYSNDNGLCKSTDGGNSWNVLKGNCDSIAVNPVNTNILYIVSYEGKLFKSTDGGTSLTNISLSLPVGLKPQQVVVDGNGTIYLYGYLYSNFSMSVNWFKSTDGGNSWQKFSNYSLGPYLIFDPQNSNIMYTYGEKVIAKLDTKGNVLKEITNPPVDYSFIVPDTKHIGVMFCGGYSGIYKSIDSGNSWIRILDIPEDRLLYLIVEPNTNTIYACYWRELKKSTDGGNSWVDINLPSTGYIDYLTIDPLNPNKIFLIIEGEIFKSVDSGNSWQKVNVTGFKYYTFRPKWIAVDPKNDNVIYAIGNYDFHKRLMKSTDDGNTWVDISGNTISKIGGSYYSTILIDSTNDNCIYVTGDGLYKSIDGGQTFNKIFDSTVSQVTIQPNNANILYIRAPYANFHGEVYKSIDGGQNWEKIAEAEVKGYITFNPTNPDSIYIGGFTQKKMFKIVETIAGIGSIVKNPDQDLYPEGSLVALRAVPGGYYKFIGWSGSVFSSNPDIQLKMDADKEIIAKFVKLTTIVLTVGRSVFTVNGTTQNLDSPPIIKNGRTLIPIRPIVESLGGNVSWDPVNKSVTISLGSTTVELWIGKNTAKVNGKSVLIDPNNQKVVPEIINGRTMLPLRFVAENIGCTVQWDQATQTITLTYGGQ